jgi:hypothetical protein
MKSNGVSNTESIGILCPEALLGILGFGFARSKFYFKKEVKKNFLLDFESKNS